MIETGQQIQKIFGGGAGLRMKGEHKGDIKTSEQASISLLGHVVL